MEVVVGLPPQQEHLQAWEQQVLACGMPCVLQAYRMIAYQMVEWVLQHVWQLSR